MKKRALAAVVSGALMLPQLSAFSVSATDPACKEVDPLKYSYEIIPLVEPFNEYFFVKTDNPHPESFRFSDKDSPYSETSVILYSDSAYADVDYTGDLLRVDGGYIFKSFSTDGGEVTLQVQEDITRAEFNTIIYGTPEPESTGYSPFHGISADTYKEYTGSMSYYIRGYYKWVDTDVKVTLPKLYDESDYLIETFADKDDFFANMDAVQSGFSKICLYSGSYIRGEISASTSRGWRLSPAGHLDQSFYIYSPFTRKENKYLLASSLYPFRHDSLGFPGIMGEVSKRLDPESTYTWSDANHAFISVTSGGVTKSYGGAGVGEGQGISEDKVLRRFSFGDKDESMTLEESRKLLDDYAAIEMDDDIPRDGELTWEQIYDTVGDGAWVDMGGRFAYLYQKDDKAKFNADEWGVGHSIYWGGSLGYCSDAWVDGRYVNAAEYATDQHFSQHPESNILMTEAVVPTITKYERKWDSAAKSYVYTAAEISTDTRKNVLFRYDKTNKLWKADMAWTDYYTGFSTFEQLTKDGIIDEKYLDMLVITPEEAEKMALDANADEPVDRAFYFDGLHENGSVYQRGDANGDGELTVADVVALSQWLLSGEGIGKGDAADLLGDSRLDSFDLVLLRKLVIKKNSPAEK